MMRLLLLLALLSSCGGSDDQCQKPSGEVCHKDPKNATIFNCDLQSKQNVTTEEFDEGGTIVLEATGDKSGHGCSFEVTGKDTNITCCYIHQERENKRGNGLCGEPKQPKECRQPNTGTYTVHEIDALIGACRLEILNAKPNDSGDYHVRFPLPPEKYNQTISVKIKTDGLTKTEGSGVVIGLLVAFVIFVAVLYFKIVKPFLLKRERNSRTKDDEAFQKLKDKDEDNFKVALGNRRVEGLRDRNYNNIFHLVAGGWKEDKKNIDWTEDVTKIVLSTKTQDDAQDILSEKKDDDCEAAGPGTLELAQLCVPNKEEIFRKMKVPVNISKWTKWITDQIPAHLWPNSLLHMTAHLDSRNKEGDTPLIIAAGKGDVDVVKVLLEESVNLNIENDGYTALHKAVANKKLEVVKELLEKGALQKNTVENGHTPLHTAVQKRFLEGVKLLVENKKDEPVLTKKSNDDRKETAFQLAVRLGEKHKEIVEFLAEHDTSWTVHKAEIMKTVYPAVAGGHKNILKVLITKGNLDWNEYSGACLLKAVEENNKTAVNNLYGKITEHLSRPSDSDREKALSNAQKSRQELMEDGKEAKSKVAQDIVDKLTSVANLDGGNNDEHETTRELVTDKLKEKRREYLNFVKKFRGKSNADTFKDRLDDLSRFSQLCEELKQLESDE